MTNAEQQLAALGFASERREPVCWQTLRIGRPQGEPRRASPQPARAANVAEGRARGPEAGCSRALLRWRDLLARAPLSSCYRISRIPD
jgi:hypothetical protein